MKLDLGYFVVARILFSVPYRMSFMSVRYSQQILPQTKSATVVVKQVATGYDLKGGLMGQDNAVAASDGAVESVAKRCCPANGRLFYRDGSPFSGGTPDSTIVL